MSSYSFYSVNRGLYSVLFKAFYFFALYRGSLGNFMTSFRLFLAYYFISFSFSIFAVSSPLYIFSKDFLSVQFFFNSTNAPSDPAKSESYLSRGSSVGWSQSTIPYWSRIFLIRFKFSMIKSIFSYYVIALNFSSLYFWAASIFYYLSIIKVLTF